MAVRSAIPKPIRFISIFTQAVLGRFEDISQIRLDHGPPARQTTPTLTQIQLGGTSLLGSAEILFRSHC